MFDKDVVAYLDASATQAADFAQTPYDKDTTYYTEDGFKADLTFTDDGELEAVEAKPYVYTADHELRYVDELTEADLDQKFYADEKGKWEVTVEANDDGELEASFVSGIDEWCSGISAATFFGYEESVYGPGVILANILNTFTEFLSVCVNEGLAMAGAPEWCIGLIVDGVLGGLFAVLGFLPQILLLFLFFSILEDSGYMARVAFVMDKLLRKIGLSGRSIVPMTRTKESQRSELFRSSAAAQNSRSLRQSQAASQLNSDSLIPTSSHI